MPRPVTISDDSILEAARELFTAKGPQATTLEIARRAGVSEGIIFKRFGSKAGLHKAAMTTGMVASWIQQETPAHGPLRTRDDFVRYLRWQLGVLREVVPIVIMAWSSRALTDDLPSELQGRRSTPLVAIRALTQMLEAEMNAGYLRKREAEAIARMLIGSVWYFVFVSLVLEKKNAGYDEDTFVEELARVVYADLEPTRPTRVRAKRGGGRGTARRARGHS